MSKKIKLHTGEILQRWDGTAPFIQPHLYYSAAVDSKLYRDSKYNIYYIIDDAIMVWCPAVRLTSHLAKLYQIKNR